MASYTDITNTLNFSVSFARTSAFPLDAYSMFGSKAAADAAALQAENAGSSNTVYYYGMPVVVFENDQADLYVINGDNTLKSVGSATYGDDKSIVLDANTGKLSLKSFGEQYYAYKEADETHADPYYELTTGWKEGLEPKVIGNITDGYSLAWYEPSATTVEGLSSSISSMQTSINTINTQINDLSTATTANTTAIETLNGDETTEGSVKQQVAEAVAKIVGDASEDFDTLKEIEDWIVNNPDGAAAMNSNITANATAINALETLVGELPEGTTATTVIQYIAEAVTAEETRALDAEKALSDRIAALEAAEKGVKSVTTNGDGTITVDGTTSTVYELPVASVTTSGGVKVDGSSITVVDGVASVIAVDATKVTNLVPTIDSEIDTKVEALDLGDTYVAKTDVVASTDAAASADLASDTKVASEKLVMSMLTWKTTM